MISDKPGRYTMTKQSMGSRSVFVFVRTQVNMQDSENLAQAAAVEDQIRLEQSAKNTFVPA